MGANSMYVGLSGKCLVSAFVQNMHQVISNIQQLYHAGQCLVGVSQCLNIQELWHQIEGMLYTIETFRSDARRKSALATLVDD